LADQECDEEEAEMLAGQEEADEDLMQIVRDALSLAFHLRIFRF
jgi:hypothetical protein